MMVELIPAGRGVAPEQHHLVPRGVVRESDSPARAWAGVRPQRPTLRVAIVLPGIGVLLRAGQVSTEEHVHAALAVEGHAVPVACRGRIARNGYGRPVRAVPLPE